LGPTDEPVFVLQYGAEYKSRPTLILQALIPGVKVAEDLQLRIDALDRF
jgi:hypothetical protein